MKLQDVFIGRAIYWALIAVVAAILAILGVNEYHVRNFVLFQFLVLGLAILVVAFIELTYRPGERITRESLDLQDDS